MTDKQIIIDGYNLEYIKELLYNGQRSAISTKTFEAIIEELERKEQECEKLKLDLNEAKAHGDYLNNLALSETLNLVSEQLDQLKAENEILEKDKANLDVINETLKVQFKQLKQTLAEIKEIAEENKLSQIGYNPDWETIIQKINECEGQ